MPPFCNRCKTFRKGDQKYLIWSCRHITCETCVKTKHQCPVCGISRHSKSYLHFAKQLEEPMKEYLKFQNFCRFRIEQSAHQLNFFINTVPKKMNPLIRLVAQRQKIIVELRKSIEKQQIREKKMTRFLQHAERAIIEQKTLSASILLGNSVISKTSGNSKSTTVT